MYICIDFDGTISDHRFPECGVEVPGAIEYMKKFIENDGFLILFTMRSGKYLDEAVEFIKDRGIDLYGVNVNPTQHQWTQSPKAYGECYIDDAAIGCPLIHPEGFHRPCVDWSVVGPIVMNKLLGEE